MNMQVKRVLCLMLSLGCIQGAVSAELTGVLKKIKERNVITIAHRESSIPFSYFDAKQKPVGYSIDLCMKVVDAIKTELKLPQLKVEFNPVTSQTRIPLVETGNVDLECGSTTNNAERQKRVAFSVSTFITSTKLLVKKSSNVQRLEDLKGKTIALAQGTTNERVIRRLNEQKQLGLKFVNAADMAQAFLSLDTGRADAFSTDDVLLAGLAANAKHPEQFAVVGEPLSFEPYAIMFRKDDAPLKAIVDRTLVGMMKSGEIRNLYQRWFMSAIPPKNVNLNLPLSAALDAQFKAPSDKGAAQ